MHKGEFWGIFSNHNLEQGSQRDMVVFI